MKRFLAFAYDSYYPSGGMGDFRGDFDTLESALASCRGEYADVLDTKTAKWDEFVWTNKVEFWSYQR